MRTLEKLNNEWQLNKKGEKSTVNLPHTFNANDVLDGAENMYRGEVTYTKVIPQYNGITYLEFKGANSICDVMINGNKVGSHKGGYSTFRFDITNYLSSPKNFLEVTVDNKDNKLVYPSHADFTFYGGLYRDVNIIHSVSNAHFSLDDFGSCGVYITAKNNGNVHVKSIISNYNSSITVLYEVLDKDGNVVASAGDKEKLHVENPTFWNGMKNPYLYTLKASLFESGKLIDCVSKRFGFREIKFDSDKGCFLNGEYIKLKGVSRHQDREEIGNALSINEHKEDLELIKEVGANSIRLAHYQQADEFYDLCDEMGFLVWAEIPVISGFSEKKQANARLQLEELIKQNMHHACIFCWGIQNEITIKGEPKALKPCLEELNDLAHKLDPSRVTTCAHLSFNDIDSPLNTITDILGYNHYFGWYMKTCAGLDTWCEKFRATNSGIKLCLSEYGAEGVIGFFSNDPVQGDYSEGYQAIYHEHYLKVINESDWLWGSYVWNMFEFGSAKRKEGGMKGKNNKGLVSWDRKIKKDAFFTYKVHWSDEKFVHMVGANYNLRTIGTHSFKVYSTVDEVTLNVNGKKQTLKGDKIFIFNDVEIKEGTNKVTITAKGAEKQTYELEGVTEYPESYKVSKKASSQIHNWFTTGSDHEVNDDYYSLEDTLRELLKNEEIREKIADVVPPLTKLLDTPLVKIVPDIKIGKLLNWKILGLNDEAREIARLYIISMEKPKK